MLAGPAPPPFLAEAPPPGCLSGSLPHVCSPGRGLSVQMPLSFLAKGWACVLAAWPVPEGSHSASPALQDALAASLLGPGCSPLRLG